MTIMKLKRPLPGIEAGERVEVNDTEWGIIEVQYKGTLVANFHRIHKDEWLEVYEPKDNIKPMSGEDILDDLVNGKMESRQSVNDWLRSRLIAHLQYILQQMPNQIEGVPDFAPEHEYNRCLGECYMVLKSEIKKLQGL